MAIHNVKYLIGHRDIKSTYSYNRSSVTQEEARAIMSMMNDNRKNNLKIPATTTYRLKVVNDITEMSKKDTVADQKYILINQENEIEDNEKDEDLFHNDE